MITKVWIDESEEECVSCGACECACEAIFHMNGNTDKVEIIGKDFATWDTEIRDAADACPAEIIKFSEDNKPVPLKKKDEPNIDVDSLYETDEERFEKPNIFTIVAMKQETLTFESAVEVLLYVLPEDHLFLRKIDAPLLDQTYGKYTSLMDIRGTWKLPKKPLNQFTAGDIFVDRQTVWYKMYVNDLAGKPFKSKTLKIQVRDLTVGQFLDFVSTQFEIANK
jgi:ferredoxin